MGKGAEARSLKLIRESGSTARVLNLGLVNERFGSTEEYRSKPLFNTATLNAALILKHVVRPHERDYFDVAPVSTTKVIFPFSKRELNLGGRAILVGERGFERAIRCASGSEDASRVDADIDLLNLINSLPSFDPFLMRERLRQSGYEPARCYFDLSDADVRRMRAFVAGEINDLVKLACANGGNASLELAQRLADKLMTDETAKALDPLRQALQLSEPDYREGVFSWKGFLYYRWVASSLFVELRKFRRDLSLARANGADYSTRAQLEELKVRMLGLLDAAAAQVESALLAYGTAFAGLGNGHPSSFRDFLLHAPSLFVPIGEAIGVIQHIVTFWRFRFGATQLRKLESDEALEIFSNFLAALDSISVKPQKAAALLL